MLRETPMTDFICAYFGGDQSGITWTITARGSASLKQAEKHGLYMLPTAGVFGFAVIAEHEDDWVLYDQFSILPPNVSVGQDPKQLNNFSVTNAPALQFV